MQVPERTATTSLAGRALALLLAALLLVTVACSGPADATDDGAGAIDTSAATSTVTAASSTADGAVEVAAGSDTTAAVDSAATALSDGASVADLVAAVNPAVVTVINEQTFTGPFANGSTTPEAVGSGTGFIISSDGYVVTNEHVVDGAEALQVIFADGTTVDAELVGADTTSDLAVLQIPAESVTATVTLGDSDALRLGDTVIAIGSALGEYTNTVTEGIVSGLERTLDASDGSSLEGMVQHDAAINPGNSGGPLFNLAGEVVGVNTAVVRQAENGEIAEGLGFAIPSSTVREIVDQLIEAGSVERPYLGITYGLLNAETAAALAIAVEQGAYVQSVEAGGPAATAGIAEGDVIVSIDGVTIGADATLQDALFAHAPGDTVTLAVWQAASGQTTTVDVTLGTRP